MAHVYSSHIVETESRMRKQSERTLRGRAIGGALATVVVACALGIATTARAQQAGHSHGSHASPPQSSREGPAPVDGEVRRIDKANGKITLKHGDIPHLDMPGMTMVFGVRDRAMIEALAKGDRVRFQVVDENGEMVITQIEKMP
ncbi:MAG: copper-binding protein [Burkholderiaceae bacterium]